LIYILLLIVWVYLHSNSFGRLRNTTRIRFGRSRSYKVIDFGTNRKRACNFLTARHSSRGPILHHLRDIASFLHPISIPP